MEIPVRPAPAGDPWTFQMAFDEREQLTNELTTLLAASSVTVGAVSVDVENEAVSVGYTYNDSPDTLSVPGWRQSHALTPYPANYVADRLLDYLGLPGTP